MSGYTVRLIGGPNDGEVLEARFPPFAGNEYITSKGRYVVLGDVEPMGAHGSLEAAAYFAPNERDEGPGTQWAPRLENAALGAIAGLMWASVALSAVGIVWLLGWALGELLERVPAFTLTMGLLIIGAVLGAVLGWAEPTKNERK